MTNVLAAIPIKRGMHPHLLAAMERCSAAMVGANGDFAIELCRFDEPIPADPNNRSIFDRPARARNLLIERHLKPHHDFVFWMDADIVEYPPHIVWALARANPGGVTAPLVLIEPFGQSSDGLFYDVAAFIESGRPVYSAGPHFGNVRHEPPFFHSAAEVVECDSVGCSFLIPADVHRSGVLFEPTPFTDHFPIMVQAKKMGLRIACARTVVAYHACLPKYGERWHSEPMDQWADFDFTKYGLTTAGRRP